MKGKQIKRQKTKLIQLQALKIFHKNENNYNFKKIQIELNKISNIIFKYHITGKKILFIGFPTNFKKTIKNTKHMFISKYCWINGMLLNHNNHKKNNKITSLNIFKLKKKLKKKVDLIVIYHFNKKSTAIEESYILRIPTITINSKIDILNYQKTTYKSIGNYNFINKKMEPNNLCISLIKTTINKAKKSKKIKIYKNFKTLKKIYHKKHN